MKGKEKELQTMEKLESNIRKTLTRLKTEKKLTVNQFNFLYPIGSRPGILYGLARIHKPLVNGIPSFRPILSAIGTSTYNIAKFLVPLMKTITNSQYSISNSFSFGEEILQQDAKLFMGSLDVSALFTSIPLDETINICADLLFHEKEVVSNLTKSDFKELLNIAVKDSIFLFNDSYYSQIDGVAMGSPLGPTLANTFMSHYEKIWLEHCPNTCLPKFYRRYVDDIFVLFNNAEQMIEFRDYLNKCHPIFRLRMNSRKMDHYLLLISK